MTDYTMRNLKEWNKRIEEAVLQEGLNFYPQEFEIVSCDDMIAAETYIGMPSHYPHWSYGKAYEKLKTLNRYGLAGLPYEMVINSDPCIAYLMKGNSLLLQILTMAHVYGHNDFFRNNRLFRTGTCAQDTLEAFRRRAQRVRRYIHDPAIGYKKVERILDAAHALRHQTSRMIGASGQEQPQAQTDIHLLRFLQGERGGFEPSEYLYGPQEDVLHFLLQFGSLAEWERDLIDAVIQEERYFLPQIETRVMNEGWASYWHYRILNKLKLEQGPHLEFLKRHNQVVKPFLGGINPYWLGFKIFTDIEQRHSLSKLFEVREIERDQSFIRRYLSLELCREMNLFGYVRDGGQYVVTQVPDEEGWKVIRDTLVRSAGMGNIPIVKVMEVMKKDNTLILSHEYDGRELDLNYACETLKYVQELWGRKVFLTTVIEGARRLITCDEGKRIAMINY